jgi:hypothetical protein
VEATASMLPGALLRASVWLCIARHVGASRYSAPVSNACTGLFIIRQLKHLPNAADPCLHTNIKRSQRARLASFCLFCMCTGGVAAHVGAMRPHCQTGAATEQLFARVGAIAADEVKQKVPVSQSLSAMSALGCTSVAPAQARRKSPAPTWRSPSPRPPLLFATAWWRGGCDPRLARQRMRCPGHGSASGGKETGAE